jgi:RNA:NAD 2'-phosphotransferase (TPT1/KptA family)
MLTREALQAHIAAGQPFLFHVTSAENVETIKREGLRPGRELGKSTRDDFLEHAPVTST